MTKLDVEVLDVGQGDAIVVTLPDSQTGILIDCYQSDKVLDHIESLNIVKLYRVFITHSDRDHIGTSSSNIALCLRNFLNNSPERKVEQILFNIDTANLSRGLRKKVLRRLLRLHKDYNIKVIIPCTTETTIDDFHGVKFEILNPGPENLAEALVEDNKTNEISIVLKLTYQKRKILLAADAKQKSWKWMLEKRIDLSADVLKFPHHGEWYDTNQKHSLANVLSLIDPSYVIISVGTKNTYNHPRKETIQLLRNSKLVFRCTQATTNCYPELLNSSVPTACGGNIKVSIENGQVFFSPQYPTRLCQTSEQ